MAGRRYGAGYKSESYERGRGRGEERVTRHTDHRDADRWADRDQQSDLREDSRRRRASGSTDRRRPHASAGPGPARTISPTAAGRCDRPPQSTRHHGDTLPHGRGRGRGAHHSQSSAAAQSRDPSPRDRGRGRGRASAIQGRGGNQPHPRSHGGAARSRDAGALSRGRGRGGNPNQSNAATAAPPDSAEPQPEFDFCADTFDPVRALAATDLTLPYPSAPPLDNLAKFYSKVLVPKSTLNARAEKARLDAAQKEKAAAAEAEKARVREKQAADSKLPPQTSAAAAKKVRPQRNVLTFMNINADGPFTTLAQALRGRHRVVVQIRGRDIGGRDGVRGQCSGVLTAFDKHMNMVLADVTETYTQRELRQPTGQVPEGCSQRQRARWAKPKLVTVPARRHVDQLLIRGDAVITVQLAAGARDGITPRP